MKPLKTETSINEFGAEPLGNSSPKVVLLNILPEVSTACLSFAESQS